MGSDESILLRNLVETVTKLVETVGIMSGKIDGIDERSKQSAVDIQNINLQRAGERGALEKQKESINIKQKLIFLFLGGAFITFWSLISAWVNSCINK